MQLVLTVDDLNKLKASTRADLLSTLFPKAQLSQTDKDLEGYWDGVVDLTPGQVEEFMDGISEQTIAGLRVFAERGPRIHASLLNEAGIENYRHFQGRVTKRTRTVTGDDEAFLFAWDDWSEADDGVGHYEVTSDTYRSLRIYFRID